MASEDELTGIVNSIEALSAPDKLRVAATLFEAGALSTAVRIARMGAAEMGALHLRRQTSPKGKADGE